MKSLKLIAALAMVMPAAGQAQHLVTAGRAANWTFSDDGVGPVRLGMSRQQVERLLGVTLESNDQDAPGCVEAFKEGRYGGLGFDFETMDRIAEEVAGVEAPEI